MVYVEWLDSTTECNTAWFDKEEVLKACAEMTVEDMTCYTAGWVVYENDIMLVMTSTQHDDEVAPYIIIPKVCVIRKESPTRW